MVVAFSFGLGVRMAPTIQSMFGGDDKGISQLTGEAEVPGVEGAAIQAQPVPPAVPAPSAEPTPAPTPQTQPQPQPVVVTPAPEPAFQPMDVEGFEATGVEEIETQNSEASSTAGNTAGVEQQPTPAPQPATNEIAAPIAVQPESANAPAPVPAAQ